MMETGERVEEMEALRRMGFGPNDYLVEFKGKIEGAILAVLVCDECGDHVRQKAVEEGRRHGVRIKFV